MPGKLSLGMAAMFPEQLLLRFVPPVRLTYTMCEQMRASTVLVSHLFFQGHLLDQGLCFLKRCCPLIVPGSQSCGRVSLEHNLITAVCCQEVIRGGISGDVAYDRSSLFAPYTPACSARSAATRAVLPMDQDGDTMIATVSRVWSSLRPRLCAAPNQATQCTANAPF